YLDRERNGAPVEELEKLGIGTLRLAAREGDVEMGSVMIGQISGLLKDIKSCDEIMQELVNGIQPAIEQAQSALK
ncbi:MAG: enoyl-[Schwartzia sp.]|nr:enoyl-[acyl-carrier-protein] reductase FabK [Schwartzia sp. (in: firmicutes)]